MKSTTITFILFSFLCFFNVEAQTVAIEFAERANIENQLKGVDDPAIRARVSKFLSKEKLYSFVSSKGESLYEKKNKEVIKDIASHAEEENRINIGGQEGVAYKNQGENLFIKDADILGRKFLIYDEIPEINWALTNEEKHIGTYLCKQAKSEHYGKAVVAWYTDELPLNNGPEEFGGLPGMILEVELPEKTITATKVSITQGDNVVFNKPEKGKKITLESFYATLDEKIKRIKSGTNSGVLDLGGK